MSEPEPELTDEELQHEWDTTLIDFISSVRLAPDVYDSTQREAWLRKWATKRFRKDGKLLRHLVLRIHKLPARIGGKLVLTPSHPRLAMFCMNIAYELAHMAPMMASKTAAALEATQLYWVTESWFTAADNLKDHQQPRHDPKRREGLVVLVEDPQLEPPCHLWCSVITRDARDHGTLGSWTRVPSSGRLSYLLPNAVYEAAGKSKPS